MTKIVNVYNVCDLDAWQRNPTNNFKFKNCLFGTTSIVKNSDKENYMHHGYGIAFSSAVSRSFNNETAVNIIIFGNSSSSHADNCKNNFLTLGKGPFFEINGSFHNQTKHKTLLEFAL